MVDLVQDDWVGAPKYWHKLVEIYSDKLRDNPRSHLYLPLADALINLGRKNDAMLTLEDGLEQFPRSRASRIMLARLQYEKGEKERAKSILEEVVALWPDATAAVGLLCEIYNDEGKIDSARKLSASLIDYMPDSTFVKELATRYMEAPGKESNPQGGALAGQLTEDLVGIGLMAPQETPGGEINEIYYEQDINDDIVKLKAMAKLETMLFRIDRLKKNTT